MGLHSAPGVEMIMREWRCNAASGRRCELGLACRSLGHGCEPGPGAPGVQNDDLRAWTCEGGSGPKIRHMVADPAAISVSQTGQFTPCTQVYHAHLSHTHLHSQECAYTCTYILFHVHIHSKTQSQAIAHTCPVPENLAKPSLGHLEVNILGTTEGLKGDSEPL